MTGDRWKSGYRMTTNSK